MPSYKEYDNALAVEIVARGLVGRHQSTSHRVGNIIVGASRAGKDSIDHA